MINFLLETLGVWLIFLVFLVMTKFGKPFYKQEYRIYLGAFLISVILSILLMLDIRIPILHQVIVNGPLSFALFYVVMFVGALKNKSKFKMVLLRVRRQMAFLGFIFLVPHVVYRLSLALSGYNSTGIIAFILMIPLVITSIPKVRRKLKGNTWKNVHKAAYIIYAMIYIHLAFTLYVSNGTFSIMFSKYSWLYHIIFVIYLALKIKNDIVVRFKKPKKSIG